MSEKTAEFQKALDHVRNKASEKKFDMAIKAYRKMQGGPKAANSISGLSRYYSGQALISWFDNGDEKSLKQHSWMASMLKRSKLQFTASIRGGGCNPVDMLYVILSDDKQI